ncbi:MAG: heme-binding protein [Pseudomonadota bacterium]
MIDKTTLSLALAREVAAAAEAHAQANGWPVVIAILDDGGHLLYLQRDDRVQLGSVDVAIAKARSAVLFRRPSAAFEELVGSGRQGYLAMPGVLAVEGGVPLEVDGQVVGAIGISGVRSHEDGQIARAGAAALGEHSGKQ